MSLKKRQLTMRQEILSQAIDSWDIIRAAIIVFICNSSTANSTLEALLRLFVIERRGAANRNLARATFWLPRAKSRTSWRMNVNKAKAYG